MDYLVHQDLENILELLELTQEELASDNIDQISRGVEIVRRIRKKYETAK